MKKLVLVLAVFFLLATFSFAGDCSCKDVSYKYKVYAFFPDGKMVTWDRACSFQTEGHKDCFCADNKWWYLVHIPFHLEEIKEK